MVSEVMICFNSLIRMEHLSDCILHLTQYTHTSQNTYDLFLETRVGVSRMRDFFINVLNFFGNLDFFWTFLIFFVDFFYFLQSH